MNEGERKLIIITAPSGAGKTSIVRDLLSHIPVLKFSISATTRPKREKEQHGKDYYFLTREQFEKNMEEGKLAEYEEVYPGKYYGTLKSVLNDIWEENKFPLIDMDVKGALRLKQEYQDRAFSVFIKPPSMEELEKRLIKRKTENQRTLGERLERASLELAHANRFDAVVVNDELEKACEDTRKLVNIFLNL